MYVRATPDDGDVDHMTSALESLSSRAVSGELRFNLVDRYQWPLALAIGCFAMEGVWLVFRGRWFAGGGRAPPRGPRGGGVCRRYKLIP